MLTFITTRTITYLHPEADNTLAKEGHLKLSGFLEDTKDKTIKNSEVFHIIDDEALDQFIKFYSNKSIDDIEIFEKEEIRYILETVGKYNTDKLNELLKSESERKEEKIYKLLSENLFDEQLMILNEMLN